MGFCLVRSFPHQRKLFIQLSFYGLELILGWLQLFILLFTNLEWSLFSRRLISGSLMSSMFLSASKIALFPWLALSISALTKLSFSHSGRRSNQKTRPNCYSKKPSTWNIHQDDSTKRASHDGQVHDEELSFVCLLSELRGESTAAVARSRLQSRRRFYVFNYDRVTDSFRFAVLLLGRT